MRLRRDPAFDGKFSAPARGGPGRQGDYADDACREPMLSFPPSGNVCNKPLDSGLRRNDGGGQGLTFVRHSKGLSEWRQTHSYLRCHSSEGSPAWMHVVERRLEPAAEESRKAGRGVRRIAMVMLAEITHVGSFPPGGNVLNQPLDSGLRRNDGKEDPRFWWNDGRSCGPDFFRSTKGCPNSDKPMLTSVVIPCRRVHK